MASRALTLVVCGAPLAVRAADIAAATTASGWDTSVIGTPATREWLDEGAVETATGRPPWTASGCRSAPLRNDTPTSGW